jgi:hypothetical protein
MAFIAPSRFPHLNPKRQVQNDLQCCSNYCACLGAACLYAIKGRIAQKCTFRFFEDIGCDFRLSLLLSDDASNQPLRRPSQDTTTFILSQAQAEVAKAARRYGSSASRLPGVASIS